MKILIFSLFPMVVISSLGFAFAQGQQSEKADPCLAYGDERLAVVIAVEQFTTAPLFCEGHESTISKLLGFGWHIAGTNQFEVYLTK